MGVGSVWTHPHYNDKNPPTPHFLIPFNPSQSHTRSAVLTLTAVWRHISEGRATGVDWQPWVAIVSALRDYAVLHFLRSQVEIDRYIGLPIFFPIFKHFTIIGYRFGKKTITNIFFFFFCHIHNYTEYNQQWNVFSAFNPSKYTHTWSSGHTHTHLEQWTHTHTHTHTWSSVHSGNAPARPPHVTLYKIHLFITH